MGYICTNCSLNNHGWCKAKKANVKKDTQVCESFCQSGDIPVSNPALKASASSIQIDEVDIGNIANQSQLFLILKAVYGINVKYSSDTERLNAIINQLVSMAEINRAHIDLNGSMGNNQSELDEDIYTNMPMLINELKKNRGTLGSDN